jgi:copper transport protein
VSGPSWPLLAVGGVVLAELLTGHTRTTEPNWLVLGADAIHVSAAALWAGGLACLFLYLRGTKGNDDLIVERASVVARFSSAATWSVIALIGAGLTLSFLEVRTFSALTSTSYGWTLVSKTALAGLVLAAGAYNKRVLVPAITRPGPPEPVSPVGSLAVATRTPPEQRAAWDKLSRTVRIELGGLALVVAATALLVNLQPAAEAAGVSGPFSTFVPFGDGQVNLVVDPNQVGANAIHVYLLDESGLPSQETGDAEIELRLPAAEIGPIIRAMQVAGPGHFTHTGPELAIAGQWTITVRQRISEFEERTAEVAVTVNP